MKPYIRFAAAALILGTVVSSVNADLYWDSNGTTTGTATTPTGTWDTSNFWSTSSAGTATTGAWTAGETAVFSAGTNGTGTFTVSLNTTEQVGGLKFEEGVVTISGGGTLNLTGAGIDTASGRVAQIDSQVSGSVGLTKTGAGTLIVNGTNNYTGTTTITGGVLQAAEGTGLPTEFLSLNGGVFQSNGSFTRSLAGSGASNMQWTASGGGFSANNGAFNVDIGGAGAELVWNTTVGSQLVGPLLFGSSTANDTTTFVNGIDMNNTGTTAGRTITVTAGAGGDAAIMSGVLRNSNAAGSLTKTGTGILVLPAANTYTGGSTISGGVLQFANTSAMPATGTINVNSGGTLGVNAGGGGSEWTNSTTPSDPASIAGLMLNGTGGQGTANQVIWANGSSLGIDGSMTYSGQIGQFYTGGAPTDAVGLNKLGSGTLTIDNTGNTATGTHTVTRGTLLLGNSEVIADIAPVSVSAGATFDMGGVNENIGSLAGAGNVTLTGALTIGHANTNTTYSGVASGGGTVTKVGTGTLTLSGANTYTGATTVNAGILAVSNATGLGTGGIAGGTTTITSGATLQVSGGITITERININGTGSTGTNGALRKTGNNTTAISGQLTGAGDIAVTAGTLRLTASSGGGDNAGFTGPITVTGGGTLRFEFISPNQLGTGNVITLDNGTLRNDNSSVPGNGSMLPSSKTITIGAGGGTLDYNTAGGLSIVNPTSAISGTGGLTKTGAGNIGMAAPCTYSGPTHVVAGFLKVRTSNERFPNGTALTIDAGATFDLDSLTETVGSLEGAGTLEINGGQFNVGGNNGTTTFTGQMNGTNGKVTKQGTGVFTVTGDNIQTGLTTVSAGTLLVNNTTGSGTGTGAVTVAAAGTLGGTGTIAGAITNNGKIAPGDGAVVGTLHASGNVTDAANSHWAIELSGSSSDQLAVGGNLDLSAVDALDITGTGTGPWVIATYVGSLTGTFDTITSGYSVDYGTGANSQITLSAAAAGLPGDFNSDGKVDAGDYATWRKNDGTNNALANDNGLGTPIGAGHYNLWRANFGNPPGAGSGAGLDSAAVPEPSTIGLVVMGLAALVFRRRGER